MLQIIDKALFMRSPVQKCTVPTTEKHHVTQMKNQTPSWWCYHKDDAVYIAELELIESTKQINNYT